MTDPRSSTYFRFCAKLYRVWLYQSGRVVVQTDRNYIEETCARGTFHNHALYMNDVQADLFSEILAACMSLSTPQYGDND
jgi:hypothetical protein